MEIRQYKVYKFAELSEKEKEKAISKFRDCHLDYYWWDHVYEDAKEAGLKIEEFYLDRNRHAEGRFIESARECAQKIVENHGPDCETFKTASAFLKERDEIVEQAPKDEDGEFVSEFELDEKLDDCEAEFLKSILEDYSIMLQKECEYLQSDEAIIETIEANDYDFTENGKID